MNILEIRNLEKFYGAKQVLSDVTMNVEEGGLFALLGPNGAGKTTLIKSVLGLTQVKKGEIFISGIDHRNYKSRENLAYFPEKFFFFPYYTVEGVLRFYAQMYGIKRIEIDEKVNRVVSITGVGEILKSRLSRISKGQLQRVGIASVLMSNARLYIFDEPFSGLDPIGIRDVKDIFKKIRSEGKTVFINSHILAEVEKIVDSIAIINHGQIGYLGSLSGLISEGTSLEDAFYSIIKDA